MANKPIVSKANVGEITAEDIFAASRALSGGGFRLYIYMLYNAENYSVEAAEKTLNIALRTTYSAFRELWNLGYLQNTAPTTYLFFCYTRRKSIR